MCLKNSHIFTQGFSHTTLEIFNILSQGSGMAQSLKFHNFVAGCFYARAGVARRPGGWPQAKGGPIRSCTDHAKSGLGSAAAVHESVIEAQKKSCIEPHLGVDIRGDSIMLMTRGARGAPKHGAHDHAIHHRTAFHLDR